MITLKRERWSRRFGRGWLRSPRRSYRRLGCERLEGRELLAVDATLALGPPLFSGSVADLAVTIDYAATAGEELVFFSLDAAPSSPELFGPGPDFSAFSFTPASPLLDAWAQIGFFNDPGFESSVEFDDALVAPLASGSYTLGTLRVDFGAAGLGSGDLFAVSIAGPETVIGVRDAAGFRFEPVRFDPGVRTSLPLEISGPSSVEEGAEYVLTIDAPGGTGYDLLIDWGDGQQETIGVEDLPVGGEVTHVFADNGSLTVRIDVEGSDGARISAGSLAVSVTNAVPVIDAGLDQTAEVNQPVTFAGSLSDSGSSDVHTIQWDFGDGSTASGTLTPTHTYTAAGDFTVTLRVQDDDMPADQWIVDTCRVIVGGDDVLPPTGSLAFPLSGAILDVDPGYVDVQWNDAGPSGVDLSTLSPDDITVTGVTIDRVEDLDGGLARYWYDQGSLLIGEVQVQAAAGAVRDQAGNASEAWSASFVFQPPQPGDVTQLVTWNYYGVQLNRRTGVWAFYGTLTNTSGASLSGPIRMVWKDLGPAGVSAVNADGTLADGSPYFEITPFAGDGVLAPGETSAPRTFALVAPPRVAYTFRTVVTAVMTPGGGPPAAASAPLTALAAPANPATPLSPHHNAINPLDVDANGLVAPLDALKLINFLNSSPWEPLPPPLTSGLQPAYLDVNSDGLVTPLDVLIVINAFNAGHPAEGEPPISWDAFSASYIHVVADGEPVAFVGPVAIGSPAASGLPAAALRPDQASRPVTARLDPLQIADSGSRSFPSAADTFFFALGSQSNGDDERDSLL